MSINWQRVGRTAVRLGRRYGPVVATEVRRRLDDRRAALPPQGHSDEVGGRPATTTDAPTESRARHLEYAPDLNGRADPGEIVWTWVEFEEHDGRGKDRPVLVIGRDGTHLLGLMLSGQARRADEAGWILIGPGPWDPEGRPSSVRLDRVLEVPEAGIRREGAVCPRPTFDSVAARLRSEHGWS